MTQSEKQRDPDCLFCKIVAGDIPNDRVYEDDHVLAFRDINPQAPTHVLVIPKTHTAQVSTTTDPNIFGQIFEGAKAVADKEGLSDYRLVINNGAGAGQTVFHLHLHVLGGRSLALAAGLTIEL